ncbi:MAG TPA: NIPSNAP family protein [Pseudorhodoplanes sp.]|jgi:hypothetical protein|nr:NIPSNAP family protein [Pseudorhodoplanes sp.]
MHYDVTTITVRPGTHPQALDRLKDRIPGDGKLLACWFSEIGALNQILIIREAPDIGRAVAARETLLTAKDPFGIAALVTAVTTDIYAPIPAMREPMQPGSYGPFFEVRLYAVKPDGLAPTIALWDKAVPPRVRLSPMLAAMHSLTGPVTRFMHIWPYPGLDERARIRAKAVAEGVWPPPGGPSHLLAMQNDIYLPAPFSPIR